MLSQGDKVRVIDHWEWPDGIIGTITEPDPVMIQLTPGEWQGLRRVMNGPKGVIITYYVLFDTPQDDGSGDGPYLGGEIEEESLRLI